MAVAEILTLHPRLRKNRDMERGRRAANAVRAGGGDAMAAALAQIGATFDETAVINGRKLRVERFIALGTGHSAVRARFGARARMIYEAVIVWRANNDLLARMAGMPPSGSDITLAIAINLVERWYRNERKAFQVAAAFGAGIPLSLEVLTELRLILRLIRASAYFRDHFLAILELILGAGLLDYYERAQDDAFAAMAR